MSSASNPPIQPFGLMENGEFGISNAAKVTDHPLYPLVIKTILFKGHKQGNLNPQIPNLFQVYFDDPSFGITFDQLINYSLGFTLFLSTFNKGKLVMRDCEAGNP